MATNDGTGQGSAASSTLARAGWKGLNLFHRGVMRATGGRVGWVARGMAVIELTTTGRRSGQRRTVVLTSPLQEDDGTYIVVASKGGADHHPDWYLNLLANPDVEVARQGQPPRPMRARPATAEEREQIWPRANAVYPNYAKYQTKTDREIPVVLLEPVPIR